LERQIKSPEQSIRSFGKESFYSAKDKTLFSQWLETKNNTFELDVEKIKIDKLDASKTSGDFKINLK
tara:strand:+ start:279 stop:479 length:201 start_codon:yes stop_codon:yes gene_type:complete